MRVGRILLVCLIVGGVFAAGYWARLSLMDQPDRVTAIEDKTDSADTAEPADSPEAETATDTAEPSAGDTGTQSGSAVQTDEGAGATQTDTAKTSGMAGESATPDRPDGADDASGSEGSDSGGTTGAADDGTAERETAARDDDATGTAGAGSGGSSNAGDAGGANDPASRRVDDPTTAESPADTASTGAAPGEPGAAGSTAARDRRTAPAVDAAESGHTPVAPADAPSASEAVTGKAKPRDSGTGSRTARADSAADTAETGPEPPQDTASGGDANRDADPVTSRPDAPPKTATQSRPDRADQPGTGPDGGAGDSAAGNEANRAREDEDQDAARDPDSNARTRRPAFDVVRVEPGGAAVIAGRAPPNSNVTVLADGEPVGDADTNAAGEFVVLPEQKLSMGRSELTLKSTGPSGATRRSADAVVIATPPREGRSASGAGAGDGDGGTTSADGGAEKKPFALKVPRKGSGGAEVMQQPRGRPAPDGSDATRLAFRVVQYTNTGGLVVSGRASDAWRVRVKLDGRRLGTTRADAGGGQWSIIHRDDIPPGLYTLKARALDDDGDVVARARTPFASQPDVQGLDDDKRVVVVQPGSNLWTIARRTYGEGVQYTTIYNANQDQIADPDLIYPGQVFVLPDAERRSAEP